MQPLRTAIRRAPQHISRITKPVPNRYLTIPSANMSLFPRFTQEFAPLFRLFDEYDRQAFRNTDHQIQSLRSFTPKFDVKETKEGYELQGELPGIEQNGINIEWTDNNTLAISGRHEYIREEGTRPQGLIESDTEFTQQSKKLEHQPDVEDEPTEISTKDAQVSKPTEQHQVGKKNEAPTTKYWVSERSVGEFHRSFAFPARVDQDAVKANLKNGILSIVVPKAQAPQPRRINIE